MNKTYQRINWQNEPSIATPLNEVNLNKVDYSLNEVDNRVISLDTSKANQSDLLQTIKTLTYNTTTGVFTFTFWNGSTYTVDLNIEKIPVDFSMDEHGVITMTTADGTEYTCDISELIKLYTFVDSSEIDFTVTTDASGNKTITAGIKEGSIVGSKLQPNFLADCQTAKNQAESAAGSASSSATSSELSSEDSEAWAVGTRNGTPVPSTDPAYENNAKYWAEHGASNSFAGLTDTNFTNLRGGQIAKYDDVAQKWINTEDEGGLLPHFKITSEAGSTVTVVCPDTSVIIPTQTSSGIWQCDVPSYGVYTVHAVINGDDAVRTVTVDTVKEYVIHDEHYSYTLNVYAPTGSSIIVTDGGSETYTGTGAGSTAVIFALHQASTTYTITVTYDGLDSSTTITSSATTGGSGSKTIEFGTINLTIDEDLIGETITMAKGTDTVSKVASSTSMVFYPNATGNWTISCEYDGETYYSEPNPVVVSSLSTAVSAEISLVHIPEGATVLPTDDIQTWLACANITDKSYTTLAEVLADRETFETLIADSNACDYMARSTSWAGDASVKVPTMTSYTAPSGVVGYSSVYSGFPWWWAFDGNISAEHDGMISGTSGYVSYQFTKSVKVNKVSFYNRTGVGGIKDFTVDYYDGTDWQTVYEGTATQESSKVKQEFVFDNNISSTTWRINILNGYGATNAIGFNGCQFTYEGATTNSDAMSLIGKYDYCSNALLGNATWAEEICNSTYFESVLNVKVPVMTSNTTPSGVCSASSNNSTAYYPFDNASDTVYVSSNGTKEGKVWYQFTHPVKIFMCEAQLKGTDSTRVPYGKFVSSNDGITFNDITTEELAPTGTYKRILNTYTEATCFGVNVRETSSATNFAVVTLQFYGRASSNVSNTNGIIHTAMGNDSVYCVETGDTFTATDGIATVDFSDFDEGVYTFGSTTAKNPNDLTEDFKKRFRITKSPYGGTTERYLLLDTIDTLYWYGYESSDLEDMSTANGWTASGITYVSPTRNTNDVYLNTSTTNQLTGIGTKNAINASTIKSIITGISNYSNMYGQMCRVTTKTNSTSDAVNIDTNIAKLYTYQGSNNIYAFIAGWKSSQGTASSKVHAFWYDRVSKDIPTFISAANDTLYIMDGNTKIYVANTNGEGKSYEPLLEAGTYTIYSSVAKDPNNLSNPYSKTVTVDESTQTIAVMPDAVKTLYWWGYENEIEDCISANGWYMIFPNSWTAPTRSTNEINMTSSSSGSYGAVGHKNPITCNKFDYIAETTGADSDGRQVALVNDKSSNPTSATDRMISTNAGLNHYSKSVTSQNCYIRADVWYGRAMKLKALWYE